MTVRSLENVNRRRRASSDAVGGVDSGFITPQTSAGVDGGRQSRLDRTTSSRRLRMQNVDAASTKLLKLRATGGFSNLLMRLFGPWRVTPFALYDFLALSFSLAENPYCKWLQRRGCGSARRPEGW